VEIVLLAGGAVAPAGALPAAAEAGGAYLPAEVELDVPVLEHLLTKINMHIRFQER